MNRYDFRASGSPSSPRSIGTAAYSPAAVDAGHVDALGKTWRIRPDERVVLAPGRVALERADPPARRRARCSTAAPAAPSS